MGTHTPERQTPSSVLATNPLLHRFAVVILFTLLSLINCTTSAIADGKLFTVVTADPVIPTIPAQRAIIGWNPPKQTLAIDTAFVAPGSDFAWLVPLPSQPDITPILPGAFEAVSAITAPPIDDDHTTGLGIAMYFYAVAIVLLWVQLKFTGTKRSRLRTLCILFSLILAPGLLLPSLAKSRGIGDASSAGIGSDPAVSVLSRSTAGVYDTAVITAVDASELLEWLTQEGFHFENDIKPVVQTYLDQGWVFASAKVSINAQSSLSNSNNTDSNSAGSPASEANTANSIDNNAQRQHEHRPHPLLFTFETDRPVYPMALTAVGNTPIQLDLYILANGSATAPNLTAQRSLTTSKAEPSKASYWSSSAHGTRDHNNNPRLVHEELDTISLGTTNITHLTGRLSPNQQAKDININVRPFVKHDPAMVLPSVVLSYTAAWFFWTSAIILIAIYLLLVTRALSTEQARSLIKRSALFIFTTTLSAGLAASTNIYTGPTTTHRPHSQVFYWFMRESERIVYTANIQSTPDRTAEAVIEEHFESSRSYHRNWPRLEQEHSHGSPMTYRVETDPHTGAAAIHARSPAGQLFVIHPDHYFPLTYQELLEISR